MEMQLYRSRELSRFHIGRALMFTHTLITLCNLSGNGSQNPHYRIQHCSEDSSKQETKHLQALLQVPDS